MISDVSAVLKMPMVQVDAHCDIHGDYLATVIVRDGVPMDPQCGVCQQEIFQREREQESKKQLEVMRQARRKAMLEAMELPERHIESVWGDYQPLTAKGGEFAERCRAYANSWQDQGHGHGNITMVGGTGTGKTFLACLVAKQVALQSRSNVLYTTVARMSRFVRSSYGKESNYTESTAFDRYADMDLLVLDEVGLTEMSGFQRGLLDEVIDERAMRKAPTILISNLSIKELEKMAQRLVDRMSERGSLMVFDWQSHRGSA